MDLLNLWYQLSYSWFLFRDNLFIFMVGKFAGYVSVMGSSSQPFKHKNQHRLQLRGFSLFVFFFLYPETLGFLSQFFKLTFLSFIIDILTIIGYQQFFTISHIRKQLISIGEMLTKDMDPEPKNCHSLYCYFYLAFYNKKEMKQISRLIDSQSTNIIQWLGTQLENSIQALNDIEQSNAINSKMEYRQNKIYYFFTDDLHSYFGTIWDHIVVENPDFESVIMEKMGQKQNNIIQDLNSDRLKIAERTPILPFDFDEESRHNKINLLRQQSDSLKKKINEINTNLQADNSETEIKDIKDMYNKLYSQQKIKEAEQFVKKNKEAQIQRRKKLEQQRKKEEAALLKKQLEIKQHEEEILKAKKEEVLKKQKQQHERRQKQKEIRQQRNTEYMRIRKSMNQKPPLYQKLYEGFSKRYNEQQTEKLTRMHSERKNYLQQITSKLLEKHIKDYDEMKSKRQRERKQREESVKSSAKSRTKIHSSYQMQKYIDPKEVEKEQAKEKAEKMRQYRSIVKEKFKPKIDTEKRKELMNLIEQMELNSKRVKRVKLENGSVMYEQLKTANPKMIGIQYLEQVKEMAAKFRQKKKEDKDVMAVVPTQQVKKPINYLEQLRKNRPKQEKSSFVEKRNMSFDDKVKKVMLESQKLAEITKQNQMMLKFGKFKTSQQILACKQEIDQNYLDIVNLKLKLILSQQRQDEEQSESEVSKK